MLIAGLLMATALGASLLAGRIRVPGLLLFLGIGMAIGSDGLGWVRFDDYELARDAGIVALALIIYEGGLSTRVSELRPVAGQAVSLAVVGTLLTALITGGAVAWLFGLPLLEGLLLGSIVASTDASAVFALLRGSPLRTRLARLLEGEAGSNDPVAILLVLGFIEWISRPDYGIGDMGVLFAEQLLIGGLAGAGIGWLAARAMRSVELPTPGLYPVASLSVAAVVFGAADVLGGSGFLAVYLAGLVLSSSAIPARRTITAFHDGLAWVGQLGLFLTLGLLVFPAQLGSFAVQGMVLAVVLALAARPIASLVSTAFAPLSVGERVLLGWAGLRGAVPVTLATFPVIAGVPAAWSSSTSCSSRSSSPCSRRVRRSSRSRAASGSRATRLPFPEPLVEIATIRRLGAEVVEYSVEAGHAIAGKRVRDLGLPRDAVVNVVIRGDTAIPPRDATRLHPGDRLHVLVRRSAAEEVDALTAWWRTGPVGPPPRPPRTVRARPPLLTIRPGADDAFAGDPLRPAAVVGEPAVAWLRVRRDVPGALVVLLDGRYAVTSPIVMVGDRDDLARHARRRMRGADDDERAWLQNVIGALAADFPPVMGSAPHGPSIRGEPA